MDRYSPIGLIMLIAILSACTSSAHTLETSRSAASTTMRPISIGNYEAAIGLQRRASEDFSHLDLQTQSELIYGSPGNDGQLLLANMTLYAPDGLLMIMMERFEGLTSSVDCKGDDGTMSLTFNSQSAFNYALQEWTYVNENDNGKILLIANHEGCGPNDQRQPYLISRITEDTAAFTTHLAAQVAPWSDVAGTYDLDFGQAIPYQKPQSLRERSSWGDIVNLGKDVLDAATGSADLSKTVKFPMNIGQQGQRTNIYTDYKGRLTLDCIDCFVSGSFAVTGHISVDHFSLQDLTLKGSPQGLQAALQIEATITSTNEPDSLQYTKELFSFPIPDAGIEVRGIFKLGATLSYDVCVSSSFSGSATIDFGLQAGMPDSAQVTADIQNPDSSSATGWSGGSLTPLFDIKKESASVKLAAFSQPKLAFGIELVKVGNIDVALTVKLPEVSVTLTAAYDENGVCGAGSSKTGVKLDSEVNIEVGLQIDASIGDNNDTAKPSWSHALYAYPVPLGSRCFPFDIPGLNSSASVTSVPALPASTSTEASAPGASTITPGAQSGQSNHVIPVPSDLAPAPSNDFSITLTSAAATVATPPLVILSMTGSRTSASLSSVSDFGQPNAKAKAVVVHSHTSLTQSDTFSLPGLLGGDNVLDALNPLTTSLIPVPMTSASICSTPTALGGDGDGYQKAAPVHPKPTSTSTPKHSATLPPKPKVTPLPPPPTPLPPPQEDPIVEKHNEAPLDPAAGTSLSIKPAPVVTTTTSEPIPTAAITTPASGGGGCRMVKRFGKRMLIC